MKKAILIVCVVIGLGSVAMGSPSAAGGIDYVKHMGGDVRRLLDNGVVYTQLSAGYHGGSPKVLYGMRPDGSVDKIEGDDTGLAVVDTLGGGTYSTLAAIPNSTQSFYGALVPEPATLSLLTLGGLALLRRRKRGMCK